MGIDPVGVDENNVHSHNRYAYANNNPYKFVDPDGRSPLSIAKRVAQSSIEGVGKLTARRNWRKAENAAMKDATKIGPNGGKVCPDCKGEFEKLDIDHADKKWVETQHEIIDKVEAGGDVSRKEVLDLYGKGIAPRCPTCNRADNKLLGAAGAGILGTGMMPSDAEASTSWRNVGEFVIETIFDVNTAE